MTIISDATLLELVVGTLFLLSLFYVYMTSHYSYWKNRSITYDEPSFPFGTDKDLVFFKRSIGRHYQQRYSKFNNEKVVGMFNLFSPYLLIRDIGLIRQMLTKDFHHFVDRSLFNPDHWTPVNRHLFNMKGEPWRIMRNKLLPAFTSGKMKMMFFLIEACCNQFIKALGTIAERNGKFEAKDFLSCFTADVIVSCGFGLESNSIENPNNEFRTYGKRVVSPPPLWQVFKIRFSNAFPEIFKRLPIERITNGGDEFFLNIVEETVAYREKNGVARNDYMDLLIKIKNNKSLYEEEKNDYSADVRNIANGEPGLTLEEMAAQALLFFAAGFETVAATMSFSLYEIAVNSDVQVKMRKEVDEVFKKYSGKPSYQAVKEMSYVCAVINETLRRYPALAILNRECTEEYRLPDLDFVIPKGMKLIIPVFAIHHDPEYYPDPYKFDPERFTDDKIPTKNNFTFFPFGEGPRICIGNRFAMLQMKLCLSMIVHNFEISPTEYIPVPLPICKRNFATNAKSPVLLKISKRRS